MGEIGGPKRGKRGFVGSFWPALFVRGGFGWMELVVDWVDMVARGQSQYVLEVQWIAYFSVLGCKGLKIIFVD